jgi:hypothetical protein
MKSELVCGGLILLLGFSALGQTNEWTKTTSGNWEESYWSLGQLPGIGQQLVSIDNSGWKAVSIGPTTATNHPQSLSLNNLLIDGPTNSLNTLLLNWALLNVPLFVHSNLTIGANGSLVSHYSALKVADADIDGSAAFMDYATEQFDQLTLRSGATFGLTNGTMTCSNLTFYNGTLTQSGGTHTAQIMNVPLPYGQYSLMYGDYNLQGGALTSQQLTLGYVMAPFGANGNGFVIQTGGVHTNGSLTLTGYEHPGGVAYAGRYELHDGLLVSSNLVNEGGYFIQSGGTNIIQQLNVHGGSYFGLSGGELIVTNEVAYIDTYVNGRFEQTGGKQTVLGQLTVQGGGYNGFWADPEYRFTGGTLTASNLEVDGATFGVDTNALLVTSNMTLQGELRIADHGMVTNKGIITVNGRTYPNTLNYISLGLADPRETQYLGALKIQGGCTIVYMVPSDSSVIHFADSHAQPWGGPLQIWFLAPSPGAHIFFGNNANALTAEQLSQVQFMSSTLTGVTNYPAMLLPTGELVPAVLPSISCTNTGQQLILTWPGGYQLTTATNIDGPYEPVPGATSGYTNMMSELQRYYRLQWSSSP